MAAYLAVTIASSPALSATAAYVTSAGFLTSAAWTLGSSLYSYATATDIEGPRVADTKVQSSTYGVPINAVYGTARVAGNIIWSTDLVEHAHDQGGGKGSKGGATSYSYTVTFAVGVCEGPITGIRRIWANGQLVYDASVGNEGPVVPTGGFVDYVTIYDGGETQEPDPRMQAEIGAANVPAHRGMAYVVFHDIPLDTFGNRIPNINFEVVDAGAQVRPDVSEISTINAECPLYDSNTGRVVRVNGSSLIFYDYWSGQDILTVTTPGSVSIEQLEHGSDGTFWAINETGSAYIYSFASMSLLETVSKPSWRNFGAWSEYNDRMILASSNLNTNISVFQKTGDAWGYVTYSTVASSYNLWGGIVVIPPTAIADFQAGWVVLYNGDKICVLDSSYSVRLDYDTPTNAADYGADGRRMAYDTNRHRVYITNDLSSLLYVLDLATLTVTIHSVSAGDNIVFHQQTDLLLGINSGATPEFSIFNPDDLPTKLDVFNLEAGVNAPESYIQGHLVEIDSVSDAVLVADTGASAANGLFKIPFGKRLSSNTILLSEIVEDQCIRAGLTAGDVNVTALTDEVNGYVVARQASARSNIEPLQVAYYFDAVESDDVLKFVKRGGSSVVTIPEADIGAYEYGTEPVALIEQTRTQETELPRTVSINYLNINADYQQNTQYDRRLTGDANIETTLTLPLALSDDEAAQIAAVNLYASWANRNSVKFKTGTKYTRYEPTDIVTVNKGNTAHTLRIVKKDEGGNGLIEWEAVSEDSAAYSQDITGAAVLSMPTQTITMPVSTRLELLDMPLLRDVDDNPGFYYAASGYRTGWHGMVLYRSVDNEASWNEINAIANESAIGNTSNALGNYSGGHTVDELNSVTVYLSNSGLTLSGTTLTNLLAGTNACLLGDEVIAFRDATLNADGSYTLTGLLRGLRGTQWAMSTHVAGDRFVLFSLTATRRLSLDSSEIDLARDYAGVSFNTTLAQTAKQEFTNTAVGLMPYAPVHLGGGRGSTGNLTINWVRCTRIGGEWRDYVDASLGEATEAYEVEIWNDGWTSLLRTITGITTSATTYTYANYLTDFGADAGGTIDLAQPYISHALTNPGAESGSTTGWTNETGAGGVRTASPAPYAGTYYFFGGTSALTVMRQRVDLLAAGWTTGELDSESLGARVAWYQNRFDTDNDNGTMGVRFLDGSQVLIGSDEYAPLAQPSTWTARNKSARMPVGTRYVDVLMKASRQSGTNNDAYFDEITLTTGTLLGGSVNVRVYQISATVGRGYKLEGTL